MNQVNVTFEFHQKGINCVEITKYARMGTHVKFSTMSDRLQRLFMGGDEPPDPNFKPDFMEMYYDGVRIKEDDTPESLGIGDGGVIISFCPYILLVPPV